MQHKQRPTFCSSLRFFSLLLAVVLADCSTQLASGQILDRDRLIREQTYFDNQDWDWFVANIPFFDCPDQEIVTTYYYRWELITKHLTYGNPDTGYLFTEFIDRPFWSGAYGAISCPAGHQLYEARWLRDPRIARDYARYWLETPGAQPRNYSTWLADSLLAVDAVHPDPQLVQRLLPNLIKNFDGWKKRHYDESVGLFWQTGHDDGMEFNIASRQTQDILRGAPSYRPSFNAYMWADAKAIAEMSRRVGKLEIAKEYDSFADGLKETMLKKLWDPKRKFFFPMFKNNEERDGYTIPAGSLVYQEGRFAGDNHGRELIGYVPWQFGMLEPSDAYDEAWAKLMDRDGFYADYGPSTVERNDPMFLLQKGCCWWSGQSWPYATTQTLKALANLLQARKTEWISAEDYAELLHIYAKSHRKEGRPYLAEALHPDTGSFEGHDGYNHSEHYFHSGFCDLVITGLVGIEDGHKDSSVQTLSIRPLVPSGWEYFALDGLQVRGHEVSVVWDKAGSRYGKGEGLLVFVDGKLAKQSKEMVPLETELPKSQVMEENKSPEQWVNHLVGNDGLYYPKITATSTQNGTSIAKLCDGNYWYMQHPPNRWESEAVERVQIDIDLGMPRTMETLDLKFLDDTLPAWTAEGRKGSEEVTKVVKAGTVALPESLKVTWMVDGKWQTPVEVPREGFRGHCPTRVKVGAQVQQIRIEMVPQKGMRVGLTEIEGWGNATMPYEVAPPPAGNLAYRGPGKEFPKASASHSDRFGGTAEKANDGKTVFNPNPVNRWTSYESKQEEDWLEIDLGSVQQFNRLELAIYDDRGGVQAPESYRVEVWKAEKWEAVDKPLFRPEKPAGSQWNEVRFEAVQSSKVRLVFRHKLPAKSGVSEVMLWNDHLSASSR